MKQQNIVILGSTGSIGEQALDIVRTHPDQFNVEGLSCKTSWEMLARQIKEFEPDYALLCDETNISQFNKEVASEKTTVLGGGGKLKKMAMLDDADIILNAIVGFAGFESTLAALQAGKRVALANKESLVVGGQLINESVDDWRSRLIPVDSEHSAIFQCLVGETTSEIEKLIITASGGPFRNASQEQMREATVEDALNHPNWSMGSKITIDSATMMNKGLEIIEAHWLFDISLDKIEPVVHPQSIIHSIVTFWDGSSKAQLGPPDMRVPILYALTYPGRMMFKGPRLNWEETLNLSFEPVDFEQFPCLNLAFQASRQGGLAPAALNAVNEVAVARFLKKEIPYIKIAEIIESCLKKLDLSGSVGLESLKEMDQRARQLALTL